MADKEVLKNNARILRKNMTKQERRLWYDFLNKYRVKFYRQKIINTYIIDFYCRKAHLGIEIDGSQHYMDKGFEYDKKRTEILSECNVEIIRFSNLEVDNYFDEVCSAIDLKVKEKLRVCECRSEGD